MQNRRRPSKAGGIVLNISQHKKLLKLLEELQAETKATDKVFKAFMEKVLELFIDDGGDSMKK